MAVPWMTDLLDVDAELAVEIAWGADLTADPTTWAWTDITTDVYQDPGITTSKGRGDEAGTAQPASCTLRVRNETGNYSLGGESPNYPNVRPGTPLRVRVDPDGDGLHVLFQGAVVGFTPRWPAPRAGYVTITASGTLRRLGQGQAPIQSSMRRDVEADPTTVAYWTCEEEGRAGAFIPSAGNYFLTWDSPPDLAAESYFECSKPLPVLKGSWWTGLASMAYTGEWLARFLAKFPEDLAQTGTSGGNVITIFTSGTAAVWRLNWFNGAATGQFELAVYESDLTPIYASGVFEAFINVALMGALISISAVQNGGNIDLSFAQSAIVDDAENTYGFSDTIAGETMGAVTGLWINQGGDLDQVTIGHVAIHNEAIAFWEGLDAARAWRGETVDERLERLETETGEAVDTSGISYTTMGPQLPKTILDLFQEAELADGGALYDGDSAGLSYQCRENRENRAADLTLTATSSQVKPGFEPTHDDQRIRNRAIITRVAAGSMTYEDRTGPLGVDAIGAYETSATVSLYDDIQQASYAAWTVHLGTHEGYRHPTITVNLADTPSLAATVLAMKPGYRIDINGLNTALIGYPGSGPVSLAVEGIQHQLQSRAWIVTFACSPYDPWNVLALEDGNASPISYVTSGAEATGDNVSLSVTPPTVYDGDDLLVLVASIRNSGTGTVDTPVGWTVLKTFGNVSVFGWLEARETYPAPGAVTTTTVSFTGGAAGATTLGQMFALRGTKARRLTNLADVIHNSATQLNGSAQDCAMPALTVSTDNCAILAIVWKQDDFTSASNPYSYTDFPIVTNSTLGSDACMFAAYGVQGAHANLSSGTYTITGGGAAISRAIVLAFLPDTLPPPPPQLDTAGSTLTSSISAGATSMSVTTTAAGPISYVGIGAIAAASNASVAPALPASLAVGDLMLIVAAIRNSGTGTVDTPEGWKALLTSGNLTVLGRYYATGDAAPTVTFTGGVANATTLAQCMAFRGVSRNIATVFNTSTSQLNGSAANMAIPGLVGSHDDVTMVLVGWKQDDWTSVATLAGQLFTEISDSPSALGDDAGLEIQYRLGGFANAKTFTTTSFTVTGGANAISRTMVLALQPETAGTWTTNALDYPIDLDVGGVKITATACTDAYSPQAMTISAAPVARTAGAAVKVWKPAVLSRPKGL